MALDPDFRIERDVLRRRFDRAAANYDDADLLAREVGRRMDERLDYIRITPRQVIDLGCGTGGDLGRLAARYPDASVLGLDFAPAMLKRSRVRSIARPTLMQRLTRSGPRTPWLAAADASRLPLLRSSVSLLWSNLMLPAMHDPLPAFREAHRVLEVGGLLMFSTLGPDTLRELRSALPDRTGERVHRFIDMHDIGDTLVQAGFSDPVMDMEMLTLTYAELDQVLHDLRIGGGGNAAASRPRGLSGRGDWSAARERYESLRRDGRLPATFEIIQGHAWKSAPRTTEDGRAIMQFHPRGGGQPV